MPSTTIHGTSLDLAPTPNEVLSLAISINGRRQKVTLIRKDMIPEHLGTESQSRKPSDATSEGDTEYADAEERPAEQGDTNGSPNSESTPAPTNYAFVNGEYYLIEDADARIHVDGPNYLELTSPISTSTWKPPESWRMGANSNANGYSAAERAVPEDQRVGHPRAW